MDQERLSTFPNPEISFSGEVPIPPNIRPVIIVKGSDYEMGYQYYQQLVQIFGPWVSTHQRIGFPPRGPWLFKEIKHQDFSKVELTLIKKQEKYIKQHAPETLSMFEGMAQGATDSGISLSFIDVLAHFLGYPGPPFNMGGDLKELAACSGFAAWEKLPETASLFVAPMAMIKLTIFHLPSLLFQKRVIISYIHHLMLLPSVDSHVTQV